MNKRQQGFHLPLSLSGSASRLGATTARIGCPVMLLLLFLTSCTTSQSPSPGGATLQAETPVELKYKWPLGKHFLYSRRSKNAGCFANGKQWAREDESTQFRLTPVKHLPDGACELEFEQEDAASFSLGVKELDDALNANHIKVYLRIVMETDGRIRSATPIRKSASGGGSPFGAMSALLGADAAAKVANQVTNGSGLFAVLPARPVKVQEAWEQATTSSGATSEATGDAELQLHHVLTTLEKHAGYECARIETTGTCSASFSSMGAELLYRGEVTGTTWFARDLGVPVEMRIDWVLNNEFSKDLQIKTSKQGKLVKILD